MKIKSIVQNFLASVTVAGLLAGCASSGVDKAASTANSLNQAAEKITQGSGLIDQSLAALNDLVRNPQPDLRKQFKTFNSSVDGLGSTAKDVSNKAESMKAQGTAYFEKWDNESAKIQNEDIRNRSAARKSEVTAKFGRISANYEQSKADFQPFMSDLRDVQKYLSTDLTTGGLASIKDVVTKANQHAVPLKASLGQLSGEFKSLGAALSPTTGATK